MQDNLTKDQIHRLLYSYCCSRDIRPSAIINVKELLENYKNVDIIRDDGAYFRIAIRGEDVELLDVLLDYYKATQMKDIPGTIEYQIAKHKLHSVLDEILEGITVENEAILERISPYITSTEGSERDDLSELDCIEIGNSSLSESEEQSETYDSNLSRLTWSNLNKLNQNKLPEIKGSGTSIHEETSYWNEYSLKAMKEILELRLKSAGVDIDEAIVIHPKYIFNATNTVPFVKDLVDQITAINIEVGNNNAARPMLLIPTNISNEHWVGMTVEYVDGKIKVTYMDSEGNSIPASLKECLTGELTWMYPNAGIEVTEKGVEQQNSNNCGLHVIENLIAAVAGEAARIDQEDALEAHSMLYEQSLLEEAWQDGGKVQNEEPTKKHQKSVGNISVGQSMNQLKTEQEPIDARYEADRLLMERMKAEQQEAAVPQPQQYSIRIPAISPNEIASSFNFFIKWLAGESGCGGGLPTHNGLSSSTLELLQDVRLHEADIRLAGRATGRDSEDFRKAIESEFKALTAPLPNKPLSSELLFSSLLEGMELTGVSDSWLQQFKSEVALSGE